MCRRPNQPPQLLQRPVVDKDISAFKQELRVFIWQMIASNNAQTLIDPLFEPIDNPIPYTKSKTNKVDDIKPALDEVLPLPTPQKKKSAKDLLAPPIDDAQITVEEAINNATTSQKPAEAPSNTAEPLQAPSKCALKQEKPKLRLIELIKQYLERRSYFKSLELQIKNRNDCCYQMLKFIDEA